MALVVVTGGTGYLGSHCVAHLLREGYHVRTTVRTAENKKKVLKALERAGVDAGNRLECCVADLTSDEGWAKVMEGATYVQHVASPVPSVDQDGQKLISTAVDGTVRVLNFARRSSVRRVVLTSSTAAVTATKEAKSRYTEADFTDETSTADPYTKSKIRAELAAWDFIKSEANTNREHPLELVVINPAGVFGPIYDKSRIQSMLVLLDVFLSGKLKWVCPDIAFAIVDARDVAKIHTLAMEKAEAKNERFILCESEKVYTFLEMANMMKPELTDKQIAQLPTKASPNFLIHLLSFVLSELRLSVPLLGQRRAPSPNKAKQFFNWTPIPASESVAVCTKDFLA